MLDNRRRMPVPASVFAAMTLVFFLVSAPPVAAAGDLLLKSVAVTDVGATHSVEGVPSKNWTVKVFVRNDGTAPVHDVWISLAAWTGRAAGLSPEKRHLGGRVGALFARKRLSSLGPRRTKAIVFHILTPRKTRKVRFGALADSGKKLKGRPSARDAMDGKITGDIAEGAAEKNNYREIVARH